MRIDVPYRPLTVHIPFHKSPSYEKHMFGAVGSGKTYAICAEAIAWCLEQPGIRGLITRKTIPELRDTTETVFFDVLPDELFKAGLATRVGGHYESFTFPNGSKVLFRSIDDWKKHKSLNLGFIAWDEQDEFDEQTYIGMKTRLRQRDPTKEGRERGAGPITRRGTFGASNPAGKNWLWNHFAKNGKGAYFKSTSFDNPYLPPDYYEELLTMPEIWIKRYVLCQFDDFAGQMYEDWGEHCIVPRYPTNPFTGDPEYPREAAFWMGMDPGTRDPTAGLWVVVERHPRPRLVGIAEYQEDGLAAHKHAAAWRRIEGRARIRVTRRIADPNRVTMRDPGSNNKLSDIFRRLGFRFELGASSYDDRFTALGSMIAAGQFVVTPDCPMTYDSIHDAKWKDLTVAQRNTGEDAAPVPLKKDRHLCDTAEYLSSRWVRPPAPSVQFDDDMPQWQVDVHKAIAKVQGRKARRGGGGRKLEGIVW